MHEQPPPPALRVLIVDDNHDEADSLHTLLELAGHKCRAAYEVHTALAEAGAFEPNVVLLDLGMFRNGFHVAEELRKRGGAVRPFIIAITGHTDQEHRLMSARAGFGLYMVKPVDPEELIGILSALAVTAATKSAAVDPPPPADYP
jgi:DNA-binding response OmpR family regulator